MTSTNKQIEGRPSPDALLAAAVQEGQGRLKIFLGAAPGVGKTFTMLENARVRAMTGADVVIGIVETHGRAETAELIFGLDIIPRLKIEYRGTVLEEMDLDTILNRRPKLVLVDELAHTNAPGSRHLKRYLDVEELLDAGIDVYTTVNIQHLESLNDAVAQITGVRVRETVPDRIMKRAAEVELVDLSVEDLLTRLREGKVYIPEQAEQAIRSYFRPGNLSALRQLALRHTAERVDDQMHSYMQAHAIPGPWPATERMLVSVGPGPLSARLVRATRRRAERRHADWIAAYVETPRHHRLSDADRNRVAQTLRLAEDLGGAAVTIPGQHVADDLIRYAQSRNVTEIVIGKSRRSLWFRLWHGSIVNELIARSGKIDVYVITGEEEGDESGTNQPSFKADPVPLNQHLNKYTWSTAAVIGAALVAEFLRSVVALPNLSMVFLVAVLVSAVMWGLRPSIYASILSVLVYDFFFVDPIFTFSVTSPQDLLALVTFLAVSVLISNLTGRVRDQARGAQKREERTAALYSLSHVVANAAGLDSMLQAVVQQVAENLGARVVALLPEHHQLVASSAHPPETTMTENERGAATWAWQHNHAAGRGTDRLPGEKWVYIPLRASHGAIGVLALDFEFDTPETVIPPDQQRLLEALADQAAVGIERARLARDIEEAKILSERDRIQAILLSSISHDLRTPLASILGSATSLLESNGTYDEASERDLINTIRDEAERLNRFVGNLLDTTRLESGALKLNREWVEIGDVIGTAISRLPRPLSQHKLTVEIEPGLPLLRLDFVLIEQVLVNLLDNAAKYSPPDTPIHVRSCRDNGTVLTEVRDEGMGIPTEDLEKVFDKFYRVQRGDRQMAGTGLGLSICRGIVEEHGGSISALSPADDVKGTIFVIRFPIDEGAPTVEQQDINQ